ncbi:hypothetical protein LCGC14_2172850 [marine sediment metagenome]|uniref:Methyltransferase FkbM domain-containing protein n=1 Tax=marine sediment metagenome TaxID=412755 RepID=A0A0F9GKB9_9ZZZZ
MVNVKINGKWDILLPKHRADRPDWYTEKGWERKRLDSMHKHLGKNDVMFYIGAEEGEMPALCQMWGAKVAMFEPNPKVWPNIKYIWDVNKLEAPLFCYQGFASDRTNDDRDHNFHKFPECVNGEVIGDHSFMELRNRNTYEVKVDDVPLIPTALSIDVEGSEWQVLKGAEKTLKKHHPKIWLSLHPEFMYEHFKLYAYDCRNWIKDRGYKEILIDYQHEVHLLYLPL